MLCAARRSVWERVRPMFHSRLLAAASLLLLSPLILCNGRLTAGDAAATRAGQDSIQAHLEAGEFGAALDQALRVPDANQRTEQLRRVSAAQRAAGEFEGAEATARRIPVAEQRSRERGAAIQEKSRSGGGSGADFDSLIDLISSTVQPETWDEVGGPGSMRQYETGVRVDPNGLLRQVTKEERTGRLEALGKKARNAALHADMSRASELRLVSLRRLEQAVAERLDNGQPVLETMQRLAGLVGIRYVFVFPDEQDIVIAGPAEGWRYDETGRPVGVASKRPMMQLDDLVVVLRTFSPGGEGIFGCSINPREANLKEVKEFVEASQSAGPLAPGRVGRWVKELQQRLGLQDVEVYGVPGNTRVAQVIVEADYRMKLIGVAKLDGGPQIPSYFDLLKSSGQAHSAPLEALRWWLTMKYTAILHSPDNTAYEIQGSSVLVQSENQFVNSQGQHVPTGISEPINRLFAQNFTNHYAELAKRDPVFADLQNIFDLGMAAALCQQQHLYERAGWNLGCFASNGQYRVADVPAPKVVETVANHRVYNGRDIVVQVAGGVRADVLSVARDQKLAGEDPGVAQVAKTAANAAKLPQRPVGRWWWDVK